MITGTSNRSVFRLLPTSLFTLLSVMALIASGAALAQPSIDELQQRVQANPNNTDHWIDLGNAHYAAGSAESAKEAFLEAVALDYRNCDAHYGLGLAEFSRGDYQAGLFAFNEVTRLCPKRFDGHFNRAVTLARLRRPGDAAGAFRDAIAEAEPEATDDDRIGALVGLAGQLERAGDAAGAAEAYREALQLRPDDDDLAYQRAQALYKAGQGLDALPDLTSLEARSDDHRVSALIADVYVDAGQVDYALRSLERALRRAEQNADPQAQGNILVKLGLLQRSLGRDAEAARAFGRAAAVDGASWEALYNLGVSYLEGGQTRSALEALEQAAALQPDAGAVQLALASAYDQLADADAALQAARRALANLNDPLLVGQARFVLARSLYRQGDYDAAARELEGVVAAQPDNAQAQLWAGLAEYQRGNYRSAALYYERAVQLDPDSVEGRINLGAAYLASERYGDAEQVYALLVQQNPGDAESHHNLGWSLISQDRRGAARDAWGSACDLGYLPSCDAIRQYF